MRPTKCKCPDLPSYADKTRKMLQMEYESDGVIESATDMVGVASHRILEDMEHFKESIEFRGAERSVVR